MRLNPYAHVVDYVVLLEMEDILVRNEFDESRCCDYNDYVFGGESFYKGRKRIDARVSHKPHFLNSQMHNLCWFNRSGRKTIGMGS